MGEPNASRNPLAGSRSGGLSRISCPHVGRSGEMSRIFCPLEIASVASLVHWGPKWWIACHNLFDLSVGMVECLSTSAHWRPNWRTASHSLSKGCRNGGMPRITCPLEVALAGSLHSLATGDRRARTYRMACPSRCRSGGVFPIIFPLAIERGKVAQVLATLRLHGGGS